MFNIVILNSYNLDCNSPSSDSVRIRYFIKGLKKEGFIKDANYRLVLIDSNNINDIEISLSRELNSSNKIDLIHAVGTPNAAVAASLTDDVPIVYYGAHPQDAGKKECTKANTCGLVLALPFTSNYKKIRFLRKLLPSVTKVYVPFYENTIFCMDVIKEKHNKYRNIVNRPAWVDTTSDYIGYTTLSNLCYVVGLEYYEYVYKDISDLNEALSQIEPVGSMLMPYNDSVYCKDAPEALINTSINRRIPLLWNNNPQATQVGGTFAVAGCFKEAGLVTGRMAGQILKGIRPSEIGYLNAKKSFGSINVTNASKLGLEYSKETIDFFDEVLF